MDFNAMTAPKLPKAEGKQEKKGAGKMLWSMAASLRNMVTKKLKGTNTMNNTNKHERLAEMDQSTAQDANARRFD